MSSSGVADTASARPAAVAGQAMTYRADIDGLRAIAVGSVVLFHMNAEWLPAGFVGVDIFFVISGFLITGLLVDEHSRSGRVDIAAFYARRVRRLLPALLLMVVAVLAAGMLLLPASGAQQQLAQSAGAAFFFVSNLFFAREPLGYFAVGAEHYPLLHTWTLAVEEQFYIVWPLLVPLAAWVAPRVGWSRKGTALATYVAIALLSFALCQWVLDWRPGWGFYLTPFRAWEFAIGAVLALVLPNWRSVPARLGSLLSVTGLALILAGFWVIDGAAVFPGPLALMPVLGSAMLLAGGAIAPASAVSRMLRAGAMTYVGRLSYGWYLWHWPPLALLSFLTDGDAGTGALLAAATGSFVIASVSYHFVESPIRARQWRAFATTRSSLMSGAALLLLGGVCAAACFVLAQRTLSHSPRLQAITAAHSDILASDPICSQYTVPYSGLAPVERCRLGASGAMRGVALWGDSHAYHLLPMLDAWGRRNDRFILPRTKGGCRPVSGAFGVVGLPPTAQNTADCAGFHRDVVAELASLRGFGIDRVVIAARWPFGGDDAFRPVGDRRDAWVAPLRQSVASARAAGLRVVLVVDTPYFGRSVPDCLALRTDAQCALPTAEMARRRADFLAVATPMAQADSGISIIDLNPHLCGGQTCPAMRDGLVMLRDAGHLSQRASRMLADWAGADLDEVLRR